jgi:hypothetical protein
MSSLVDHRWGLKKETVYNTPVVVDRFYPWLKVEPDWDNRIRFAKGLAGGGGRRRTLGARAVVPRGLGSIKLSAELESKQGGVLYDLAFGVSTVTAITGGSQQVFNNGLTTGFLPSATVQVVDVSNPGTDYVLTYSGCTVEKATITQPEDDIPMIEVEFDCASLSTATAAATATYASGVLFDASQITSAGLGGAFVAPTTIALATVATSFLDWREFKVTIDNKLDGTDAWPLSGRAQPVAGVPDIKFDGKANFQNTTIPTAYIVGTKLPWQATWTTGETLGAGFSQLQLAIPQMQLTKGMPKPDMGKIGTIDVSAMVTNDGTNKDIYLVYRTTDTTL